MNLFHIKSVQLAASVLGLRVSEPEHVSLLGAAWQITVAMWVSQM